MECPTSESEKRAEAGSLRHENDAPKGNPGAVRIPLKQRFCYGLGHVINDLSAYAAFSYVLVFWTKVVGIKHTSAGVIFLVAQIGDAISSPLIGYMCDRFNVPLFSRIGRRKGWHLLGTILLLLLNPLLFGRCFLCALGDSTWFAIIYYSVIITTLQIGFASVQISHLSLLSEIARKPSQAVDLNSIRATFTFLSGIFIYGVTWILLGESSGGEISPQQWKQFLYLGLILVGIGALTSLIFYVGVNEPSAEVIDRQIQGADGKTVPPNKEAHETGFNNFSFRKTSAATSAQEEFGIDNTALATEDEAANETSDRKSRESGSSRGSGSSRNDDMALSIIGDQSAGSCDQEQELPSSSEQSDEDGACEVDKNVNESTQQVAHDEENGKARAKESHWWWFRTASFYHIAIVYMCSRLVNNVSNSYFPLFLIDALQFEKEAIAYFPLVALVSGVVFSTATKKLNKILGSKASFCAAAVTVIGASIWYHQLSKSNRNLVYGAAIMMGSGTSVIQVTVLAMVNDFIGHRKESSALMYGLMSFIDKLATGSSIALIQEFYPEGCERGGCAAYVRLAFSMTCGIAASVALVMVALFSKPRIVCHVQVETKVTGTQTDAAVMVTEEELAFAPYGLQSFDTSM